MKTNLKSLLAQAKETVSTLKTAEAGGLVGDPEVAFIDVRDSHELWADGWIPGAINVSRGMLEFAVDPESPYYNPVFSSGKLLVFYCKSGGRSILAARRAMDMGVANIVNLSGGMLAWKQDVGVLEI